MDDFISFTQVKCFQNHLMIIIFVCRKRQNSEYYQKPFRNIQNVYDFVTL